MPKNDIYNSIVSVIYNIHKKLRLSYRYFKISFNDQHATAFIEYTNKMIQQKEEHICITK